jgi:hypothetical protein
VPGSQVGTARVRRVSTPDRDAGLVVPPPASIRSGPVTLAGTIVFLVAFLALLPFYGRLGDDGHRIWLWTCLAGFLEGLFGSTLAYRHRRAGRAS